MDDSGQKSLLKSACENKTSRECAIDEESLDSITTERQSMETDGNASKHFQRIVPKLPLQISSLTTQISEAKKTTDTVPDAAKSQLLLQTSEVWKPSVPETAGALAINSTTVAMHSALFVAEHTESLIRNVWLEREQNQGVRKSTGLPDAQFEQSFENWNDYYGKGW
jgi:hypothetical protein